MCTISCKFTNELNENECSLSLNDFVSFTNNDYA